MSRNWWAGGVGVALTGHALAISIPLVLALWLAAPDNGYDEDRTWFFLYGSLLGQLLLLPLAIAVGAVLVSKPPRRRFRAGVFAGWRVGLLLVPFLWYGLWHSMIRLGA